MSITITSLTFDKSLYNPGETVTLTVDYTTTDFSGTANSTPSVNVTVSDSSGVSVNESAMFTVAGTGETPLPTTVSAVDNRTPPGTWTLVSNVISGTVSPWTGVAVLTSVA